MPKKKTKKRRSMAGKAASDIGSKINKAAKGGNLLMGSNSVFRGMKKRDLETVICASNLPEPSRKDMNHYASVSGIEVREFGGDSSKLGETCGKPFNILLVGIKK